MRAAFGAGAILPFAGIELDRASERREEADWLRQAWDDAHIVLLDEEGRAAMDEAGRNLRHWRAADLPAVAFESSSFLGLQGTRSWFALPAGAAAQEVAGWVDLRRAAMDLNAFEAGLFAFARGLLHWQTRSRYCGACGAATRLARAGHTARCSRDGCGIEHYPRTDPAIIVLLTHGDAALLARQSWWPAGRYSTVAGFVEPGESLEDALAREVAEETGLRVIKSRYLGSQPWPFPASLMLGYRAEVASRDLAIGDELEDARWFNASTLVEAMRSGEIKPPASVSISHALLRDWLIEQGQESEADVLLAAVR
jgi:NAD+ diphosphatase